MKVATIDQLPKFERTALRIAEQLDPTTGPYERRIVEAAVRLCGAGLQQMEYQTQWSSGATVWRAVIDGQVAIRVVPAK